MSFVRVTISGFNAKDVRIESEIIKLLASEEIEKIAKLTEQVIRFNIQTSIERSGSTGNLALAFVAEPIPGVIGWGVGNIEFLNRTVPYWYWINYGVAQTGRRIPPGTDFDPAIKGHFDAPSQGRFQKGQPLFPMIPTKPIAAHNYIARTLAQQNQIISSVINQRKTI